MNKKTLYFSELRAIACMAIVLLHTAALAVNQFEASETERMVSYLIRNCLLWAVPCFVMVTGALLLDPSRDMPMKKIIKYIRRVLLALVVFALLFAVFDAAVDGTGPCPAVLQTWIVQVLTNTGWLHMWYLYLLLALYLMLPIERLVSAHASDRELKYLLVLYLVFLLVVPTVNTLTGKNFGGYITVYTVYPFYFFLGYALHFHKASFSRLLSWLMLLAGTGTTLTLTVFALTMKNERLWGLCGNYAFVGVALQAVGLFAVMNRRGEKAGKSLLSRILCRIDSCSFGIYLIHVLVLQVIYKLLGVNPYQAGSGLLLFAVAIPAFMVSWLSVWFLRKLPGIKAIL